MALASSTAFNSHGSEHIWHAPIYGHFERGNMEMMFHRTCLESNDFAVGDGRTSTAADHPQDIFLGEFVDVFWEFNMEKSHGKTKESRLINPGTQIISNNFLVAVASTIRTMAAAEISQLRNLVAAVAQISEPLLVSAEITIRTPAQ